MPALVISLDFELFWGVSESRTIESYGENISGVWQAVPAMLKLFERYGIHATWATVGMLMCKDFKQWSDFRPDLMPTYGRKECSTYSVAELARKFPTLFFAPPLVEQILATPGQELGSHTYSHFYCSEKDTTAAQFAADMDCAKRIFDSYNVKPSSFVFPRNQICEAYMDMLSAAGFTAYRGNQDHWIYRNGHLAPVAFGSLRRLMRIGDTYFPVTGNHTSSWPTDISQDQLINLPASRFLRPVSSYSTVNELQMHWIMRGMKEAAMTERIFHLWWHPHNFGRNTEENLNNLEKLLMYYRELNNQYGMMSLSMKDVDQLCRIKKVSYAEKNKDMSRHIVA